jgi:hypothetical protein
MPQWMLEVDRPTDRQKDRLDRTRQDRRDKAGKGEISRWWVLLLSLSSRLAVAWYCARVGVMRRDL